MTSLLLRMRFWLAFRLLGKRYFMYPQPVTPGALYIVPVPPESVPKCWGGDSPSQDNGGAERGD